jgi:hypothetical protein
MIAAMKSGDALKVSVLRMLISELNYKKIDLQRELTDEDVTGVIAREVKKRKEAILAYESAGRNEQAETEKKELDILNSFMPAQLGEEEITDRITHMKELKGITDFGQAMKIVAPIFKGKADGAMIAMIVKKHLA